MPVRKKHPLWPAGHLPHKGGEDVRRGLSLTIGIQSEFAQNRAIGSHLQVSPLVGEMGGSPERAFFHHPITTGVPYL
ncbi:hypothetical protein C8J32_102214 [Rhizobium sp. PP-CC-3A-592]|nr:hypothetical protein C8J32_102214 [Rhizobium sp. PP-CC-3A-592]